MKWKKKRKGIAFVDDNDVDDDNDANEFNFLF